MFNLLDASGGIGVTERTAYILRVRSLAVRIAEAWVGKNAE
jgi:glycyl-tRNA synthetase alpha subunit